MEANDPKFKVYTIHICTTYLASLLRGLEAIFIYRYLPCIPTYLIYFTCCIYHLRQASHLPVEFQLVHLLPAERLSRSERGPNTAATRDLYLWGTYGENPALACPYLCGSPGSQGFRATFTLTDTGYVPGQ